ncbi:hypothetical protein EVA_17546 [gut metagenome]|uniref:Uncharacterized protein n=1 Tax=gut metagenome TaxID=749906 RepID=J9FIT5_9ZZZZ
MLCLSVMITSIMQSMPLFVQQILKELWAIAPAVKRNIHFVSQMAAEMKSTFLSVP